MDEGIVSALLKRAKGYKYDEVQEEYVVREDGEIVLSKRKIAEKYCPPDSTALKTYLELCKDRDVQDFTDEELEIERNKLLAQLARECGDCPRIGALKNAVNENKTQGERNVKV